MVWLSRHSHFYDCALKLITWWKLLQMPIYRIKISIQNKNIAIISIRLFVSICISTTQALVGSRGKALGRGPVGLSPPSSHSFLHLFFFRSASISRALVVSLSEGTPCLYHACAKRRWQLGGRKCRKMPESDICVCRKVIIVESHIVHNETELKKKNWFWKFGFTEIP